MEISPFFPPHLKGSAIFKSEKTDLKTGSNRIVEELYFEININTTYNKLKKYTKPITYFIYIFCEI